jgi:hypothetical protein
MHGMTSHAPRTPSVELIWLVPMLLALVAIRHPLVAEGPLRLAGPNFISIPGAYGTAQHHSYR